MKKVRIALILIMAAIIIIFITGCWNYKEIDKLGIVAGVAIDKGTDGQYIVTAELVQNSGGKDSKAISKVIALEGKTIFDTVRDGISTTGKRLYWSHAKVLIFSREIVNDGISKVIDWYLRDSETREDVNILISEAASAKEILESQGTTDDIKSFTLDEVLKNQVSLSKAPITNMLKFSIESKTKQISTIIPTVKLKQIDDKIVPQVIGTAIIKNDKLEGFLNGEETEVLMFIRNEIKGGVLVEGKEGNAIKAPVSLEIFKSKTKVKPIVNGRNIEISLNIDTTAAIDEIDGTQNYIDEDGRTKLEHAAENTLKERIEALIRKVQSEYDADIFGFGRNLQETKNNTWKRVRNDWGIIFKDLKVNIKTRVHIRNSALLSKPFGEGD